MRRLTVTAPLRVTKAAPSARVLARRQDAPVAYPRLAVLLAGGQACPGSCSMTYPSGTSVALSAKAGAGSKFFGWSGACGGTGVCSVTMSADQTVTAAFVKQSGPPKCSLNVQSNKVLLATPSKGKKPKKTKKPKVPKTLPGTLALTVKCDQAAKVTLTGKITEPLGKKPKHGKQRSKTFGLGPVSATVKPGVKRSLIVKLPKGALTALTGGARESATFSLTAANTNGRGTSSAKIGRLRLIRAR